MIYQATECMQITPQVRPLSMVLRTEIRLRFRPCFHDVESDEQTVDWRVLINPRSCPTNDNYHRQVKPLETQTRCFIHKCNLIGRRVGLGRLIVAFQPTDRPTTTRLVSAKSTTHFNQCYHDVSIPAEGHL